MRRSQTPSIPTAAVVGGGPAGLATAACLGRGGVDALVLESASRVAITGAATTTACISGAR